MNEEKFKKVSKILTAIANTYGIYDYIITPTESELLIEYLSWVWEKIHFSEKQLEESKAEANTFRQLAVSEARKHNKLKNRWNNLKAILNKQIIDWEHVENEELSGMVQEDRQILFIMQEMEKETINDDRDRRIQTKRF